MSDASIRVLSLGKIFRVWRQPSDMLKEALTGRRQHSEYEALRDISFDVPKGSVVGIIGRNGAGKSTLLRIIAGTLDATSGIVSVAGRISAILELGTGFHPEYTGRENVFLGGLCLGLTHSEIASRLNEIVAFAELQDFINQPFRTYSSGMQARLTFAVATAVDPDILIIDEALAVGDARFQLKSFDRIRAFRQQGKSILLVSHSIEQIVSVCDHVILIEKGRVFARGEASKVANIYHELLFGPQKTGPALLESDGAVRAAERPDITLVQASMLAEFNASRCNAVCANFDTSSAGEAGEILHRDTRPAEKPRYPLLDAIRSDDAVGREHRYGDGAVRIVDFFIKEVQGHRVSRITSLQRYEFVMLLSALRAAEQLGVGILVRTPRGIEVFGANTFLLPGFPTFDMAEGDRLRVRVPFVANLSHGIYFATAVVAGSDSVKHDARFDALEFTVDRTYYHDASLTNLDPRFIYEKPTKKPDYLEQQGETGTP